MSFEDEIESLLHATLDQQPGWHDMEKLPGDEPMSLDWRVYLLEARVQAYRTVIFRLVREIAALKGEGEV